MRLLYLWLRAALLHPIRSLVALFWLLLGKRLRAHNRFSVLIEDERYRYEKWLQKNAELSEERRAEIIEAVSKGSENKIVFRIYSEVSSVDERPFVARTVASLKAQLYPHWELVLIGADAHEQFSDARIRYHNEMPEGEAGKGYLGWLRPGDLLAEHALYECAVAAEARPALIYTDEDQINHKGVRRHSHFKPHWNYELLLACDYIGGLCFVDAARLPVGIAFSVKAQARYELLLQLGRELPREEVSHVPHVLYHRFVRRFVGAEIIRPSLSGIDHGRALERCTSGAAGDAKVLQGSFGHIRQSRPVGADEPLVSLIIPTRDMRRLTRNCVRSILAKTRYKNYEILIVNNDSQKPATHRFLENIARNDKVRVLDYPGEFNYSAINNFAAREAKGSYIGLINNDTEVITPEWLEELMGQAVREDVGAVGAKLLYSDGRIQHAGVYTGMGGLAGHGHRFLKANDPGYFYRAHLSQYVSAVTAACLIVRKDKFFEVGGLDETVFRVAFNDVDLCLKLQAAGYHNIYHPHAVLYHYESKSRGKDLKGAKRERYLGEAAALKAKWGTDTEIDRYFNKNLAPHREDFVL
ncbi:glycosyltransferase family 2 protein [Kordiimonas sp.]|uniref:glycosyltransferase family 2 protein n=1 Tax=Kordiimonas sp. TaxID=1970157 RepID=UPI003A946216